jgi:hypothetical protein
MSGTSGTSRSLFRSEQGRNTLKPAVQTARAFGLRPPLGRSVSMLPQTPPSPIGCHFQNPVESYIDLVLRSMKILSKIQDYELTENVIDAGQGRTERWRCRYISAMNTELKTLVKYRPFYLPRCRPDRLWLTFDRDLQVELILEGRKEDVRYRLLRYRAAAQLLNRFVTIKTFTCTHDSKIHRMRRCPHCIRSLHECDRS